VTQAPQQVFPQPQPPPSPPGEEHVRKFRDSTGPLIVYLVLLFGLPAQLVFAPLGAAGSPSTVFGMVFFIWWLYARLVPSLGAAVGRQPMRVALLCFQIITLVSFLAGALRPMTSEEASSSARGLLSLCAWSGILLVAADGIRTRASLERLLRALVAGATFLAALGLIQFFTGWNPASMISIPGLHLNQPFATDLARSSFVRVQGTATHAIEFGVVLCMVFPLALHNAWFAKDHKRRRWLMAGSIAVVLPMTVSRSAMLGLGVILAVMLATWPSERRRKVLLISPVLLVVLKFIVPGLLGTLKGLFLGIQNDPSAQGRTDDYNAVAFYVSKTPWIGRGLSTFIPEMYRTLDNAYLGWVVEAGIIGLIVLIGFQLAGLVVAWQVRIRARQDEETRDLAASIFAGLLAGTLNFATFDALGFAMFAGTYFLMLGIVGALWRVVTLGDADRQTETFAERLRRRLGERQVRWRLFVQAATAALALGVVMVPGVVGMQYTSMGSVLLRGPHTPGSGANPYVYSPYMNIASDVLQRSVRSDATQAQLRRAGYRAEYTMAVGLGSLEPLTDRNGEGILIRIRSVADNPADALLTRDAVIAELKTQLREMQDQALVVSAEQITLDVVTAPNIAGSHGGSPRRAQVAAVAIGYLIGGAGWRTGLILREILLRRRRRPTTPLPSHAPSSVTAMT
jgi:O-antigen ligase